MAKPTLADRLRDLRKEKGVSQSEAADMIGVSRSYLAGLESGADAPGRETLIAIADYYDASLDWLGSGQGDKRPMRALNQDEETILRAYRKLPSDEADGLRRMLVARTGA